MNVLKSARAPWTDLLLVCGKCARKAGKRKFGKHLKAALKHAGCDKRTRVVESSCLDLCPKRRIAIAVGRDVGARRLLVVLPEAVDETAIALAAAWQAAPLQGMVERNHIVLAGERLGSGQDP